MVRGRQTKNRISFSENLPLEGVVVISGVRFYLIISRSVQIGVAIRQKRLA